MIIYQANHPIIKDAVGSEMYCFHCDSEIEDEDEDEQLTINGWFLEKYNFIIDF